MASGLFSRGLVALQDGSKDFLTDVVQYILVDSTYSLNKEDTLATVAAKEISVSGYAGGYAGAGRKTAGSKTLTRDATNHRAVFDAADPTAWTLATGVTVGGVVTILKGATADSDGYPLAFDDVTDVPTNGGTVTYSPSTDGIAYIAT